MPNVNRALVNLSLALLLLLLLPFLIITWFNNPSIDDYAFVYYTKTLGLIGAQVMWYTQWTGRYTGMFLMSLHPMLLDSFILYKLVSGVIILLSWHALYRFSLRVFRFQSKGVAFAISLMALFVYMNGMPTLVQGFYWEAGAVTYQLGNVLVLHWIVNVYPKEHSEKGKTGYIQVLLNAVIIFVACGLSETVMLTMLLASAIFSGWKVWEKGKPDKISTLYLAIAMVCSAAVYFAPGNSVRSDIETESTVVGNALPSIYYSLKAGISHAVSWVFTFEWIIFTGAFIALIASFAPAREKQASLTQRAIGLILGLGVVSATFTPGFFATGLIPPERVVNVSYWTFLVVWMCWIAFISSQYSARIRNVVGNRGVFVLLSAVLLFWASIDKSDNVYAAGSDILSGRAERHNKEVQSREALVKSCADSICQIPAFTVFPKSVFNEDMANYFDRSNLIWYAHHHEKESIEGFFIKPETGLHKYFDFEGDDSQVLGNYETIIDTMAFSGQRSSFVKAGEGFSASYRIKMGEMDVSNIYFLGRVQIAAKVFTTNANCSADLVFVLNNPSRSEPLVWRGGPIVCDSTKTGTWQDVKMLLPLEKRFIHPKHEIVVYLWNHGSSDVFLDDLDIWIY